MPPKKKNHRTPFHADVEQIKPVPGMTKKRGLSRHLAGEVAVSWLAMLAAAVGLGSLRQGLLAPRIGELPARAAGTLLLCAVIVLLAVRLVRRHPAPPATRLVVGVCWCVPTLAFEFLAGHYLFGASWEALWADWNLAAGHLWPLVPATALLAPLWAGRRRTRDPFRRGPADSPSPRGGNRLS